MFFPKLYTRKSTKYKYKIEYKMYKKAFHT